MSILFGLAAIALIAIALISFLVFIVRFLYFFYDYKIINGNLHFIVFRFFTLFKISLGDIVEVSFFSRKDSLKPMLGGLFVLRLGNRVFSDGLLIKFHKHIDIIIAITPRESEKMLHQIKKVLSQ